MTESHIPGLPDDECASCPEGMPEGECTRSLRACGHHCNHSWEQDVCHWCGKEFGEDEEDVVGVRLEPELCP